MRASYDQIRSVGAAVLAIAPGPVDEVRAGADDLRLPFPCLADPDGAVFRRYGVGSSILSLGQRPATFLIGPGGELARAWRARQQWENPTVTEILDALSRRHA